MRRLPIVGPTFFAAALLLTSCATTPAAETSQVPTNPAASSLPSDFTPTISLPDTSPVVSDPVVSDQALPSVSPTPSQSSSTTAQAPPLPGQDATPTPQTSLAGIAPTSGTTPGENNADSTFSFVVLPDTQNETGQSSTQFMDRARWIVANKSRRDIRFVTSSGDVHNWPDAEPRQLQVSSAGMKVIEAAGLPYTLALGNHDTKAVCWGGSACPGANTSQTVRSAPGFNATYNAARYRNVGGSFQPGRVDNIYATYAAGGLRWMVLVLELWPRQTVIDWAKQVVASHPHHNVIVVTHSYLTGSGSIAGDNGGYGATSPQHLYNSLISVYPNIRMVFSGHVGTAASRVDKGTHGNTILSFLQCYHSGTDTPTRVVEVDVAHNTVTSSVLNTRTGSTYPGTSVTRSGMAFVK